jgi:hypothetical protein
MSFQDSLDIPQKQVNVIISIDGEYFAQKLPDSGLVVDTRNLILDDPIINGVDVDIRRASTPVGSFTFKLKDENAYISAKIMGDEQNFLEREVIVYLGFITGNYDFSDYIEISRTRINSVTKIANGYSIRSKETTALLTNPTFNIFDKLDIDILAVSTTLDLQDASIFPNSGVIKIANEFIIFAGKTDNTLTGLIRGYIGTAADHDLGSEVYLVTEFEDVNPIDLLLTMMLSKNGDGANDPTYDIYKFGLGIDPALVDIASFEAVRDTFFIDELLNLKIFNEPDTLKWIEGEILQPTNIRLFTSNGVISLALLDQVEIGDDVREVNEDVIIDTPTWNLTSDKVHNVIKINYDYDYAAARFLSNVEFRDSQSIAVFGEKKPLVFSFKGVKTAIGGAAFAAKSAERLLARLSTARGTVNVRTLFDTVDINIGDDILLGHRFLPQQGGSLGIYDQIEVVSKNIDLKNATCSFKLEYTSFTGFRIGFISPCPLLSSVINQRVFTVPDGSAYRVGYALRLWDNLTNDYLPDALNFIQSINGNEITMLNDFSTPLNTDIRLKFPDYDSASNEQKARYAFIGENTGFFNDGSKSYQIIF